MTTLEEKIQKVVDFSGVDRSVAEAALLKHPEVVDALAEISVVPEIRGAKYIPPTPVVNHGHDAETLERIRQGRILSDILSASPRNDLRGKAAHYPQREASGSGEQTQVTVPTVESSK